MYKLIATDYNEKQHIRLFENATEARDWYNELIIIKHIAFIEIFEIEKLTRDRLNMYAQLEEECLALGCDDNE